MKNFGKFSIWKNNLEKYFIERNFSILRKFSKIFVEEFF